MSQVLDNTILTQSSQDILPKSPSNSTLNQSTKYTHDELHEALLKAEDILDRALCPFILIDETAKQLLTESPTLDLPEISIAVMKKHWTPEVKSIVMMYQKDIELNKVNAMFKVGVVPVVIWVIERDYSFFQNPDTRWYYQTQFRIPNPFRQYWKDRDLIR